MTVCLYFLISQNISADLKGPKVKYYLHYRLCNGPPFMTGTTPAAVTANKTILAFVILILAFGIISLREPAYALYNVF